MSPSISSKTQLTRVERTWRFSCRARDRVIGPFIVCIEVTSSSSPLQSLDHKKHKSKGGKTTYTRFNPQHTHAHKPRLELKAQHREFTTRMELKSLTQRIKCVEAESGCLSMLRECLVSSSMRYRSWLYHRKRLGKLQRKWYSLWNQTSGRSGGIR